ncbi:MAG: hypothetical protein ACKVON_15065, partial [Beijerinckiaceae bacterium]
ELIEVWRPARFDRERPPQNRQNRDRGRANRPAQSAPQAEAAQGETPTQNPQSRPDRGGAGRKPWQKRDGKNGNAGPETQAGRPSFPGKHPDSGNRQEAGKRPAFGNRPDGGERVEGFRRQKPGFDKRQGGFNAGNFKPAEPPREKLADPDSPFAQLAALKAKLEGKA